MKHWTWCLILLACIASIAQTASAREQWGDQPAITLHVADASPVPNCGLPGLNRYTVWQSVPLLSGPTGPFFVVYLLACNGTDDIGIAGFECGVTYPGGFSPAGGLSPINVFSWNLCADSETSAGGWPAPGGSNRISWAPNNCQRTRSDPGEAGSVVAVAGYFYVAAYAPEGISLTPRNDTNQATWFGCDGSSFNLAGQMPSTFGVAGFGGFQGYNSCISYIIPTARETWGRLKTLFR